MATNLPALPSVPDIAPLGSSSDFNSNPYAGVSTPASQYLENTFTSPAGAQAIISSFQNSTSTSNTGNTTAASSTASTTSNSSTPPAGVLNAIQWFYNKSSQNMQGENYLENIVFVILGIALIVVGAYSFKTSSTVIQSVGRLGKKAVETGAKISEAAGAAA